jgi:hypothetical protein
MLKGAGMQEPQISVTANGEVLQALDRYKQLIQTRESEGTLTPSTANTYLLHAENFVRWLHGDFDPGGRNR